MRVPMTEYLFIDLDTERWTCRVCGHDLGDANDNYKPGCLAYDRDPREIHQPILDPQMYEYTFSPDPTYCRIIEYYCPGCATQLECEYVPPGHPPVIDMVIDVAALRKQWEEIGEDPEAVFNYGPGEDAQKYTAELKAAGKLR